MKYKSPTAYVWNSSFSWSRRVCKIYSELQRMKRLRDQLQQKHISHTHTYTHVVGFFFRLINFSLQLFSWCVVGVKCSAFNDCVSIKFEWRSCWVQKDQRWNVQVMEEEMKQKQMVCLCVCSFLCLFASFLHSSLISFCLSFFLSCSLLSFSFAFFLHLWLCKT